MRIALMPLLTASPDLEAGTARARSPPPSKSPPRPIADARQRRSTLTLKDTRAKEGKSLLKMIEQRQRASDF